EMFKFIRKYLPDYGFVRYIITQSIPGKGLLGSYRFIPFFFLTGVAFEFLLYGLKINNISFYDTFKKRRAEEFVRKKHQLDDYLTNLPLGAWIIWFLYMYRARAIYHLCLNVIALAVGSQITHIILNPMKDFAHYIQLAEIDYQKKLTQDKLKQEEDKIVQEYLLEKKNLKQPS
ncbi:unnamed protein product, partial [Didymodactylos carnosus]